jgi:probable HAF family extracellular repeat protein
MSISLKKFSARMLSLAAGCTFASILAACGGDGHAGGRTSAYPPTPPVPAPAPALTYDVIPLSLGGPGLKIFVGPKGITADGKVVAGTLDVANGMKHAFLYDGAKIIDLGTMGGEESEVAGMNQLGHVVGQVRFANGSLHAFLYDGTMHDLGTLGGMSSSVATDINDRGQVTGYAVGADGIAHAFLYENGMMKQLKTPAGPAGSSQGRLINASGVVAGLYDAPDGATRTFLATACNCPKDVGTLGGNRTIGYALNDAGLLAGVASDANGNVQRAFLYENGAIRDLGTLGGSSALATAMNQAGQVVGYASTANGESHAFLYDGQSLRDLGTLPGGAFYQATAINAAGQVIGSALDIDRGRAITWTAATGLVDLNTVLNNPPAGLVLQQTFAISDNGSIVAEANQGLVLLKVHQRP